MKRCFKIYISCNKLQKRLKVLSCNKLQKRLKVLLLEAKLSNIMYIYLNILNSLNANTFSVVPTTYVAVKQN